MEHSDGLQMELIRAREEAQLPMGPQRNLPCPFIISKDLDPHNIPQWGLRAFVNGVLATLKV